MTTTSAEYTLYGQPYLLFPRRLHSYLKAKPLPNDVKVTMHHCDLESGAMSTPPGKIEGSIPMLKFGAAEETSPNGASPEGASPKSAMYIRQSSAILNYLEEVHPRKGAYEYVADDMRGGNAMERAHVLEVIGIVEDATQAFGFWGMQSSELYASMAPQSKEGAMAAKGRLLKCLAVVEGYLKDFREEAAAAGRSRDAWAAGTTKMTFADLVLGGVIQYAKDLYGKDLVSLGEFPVMKGWLERWEGTEVGRPGGEKIPPDAELRERAQRFKW